MIRYDVTVLIESVEVDDHGDIVPDSREHYEDCKLAEFEDVELAVSYMADVARIAPKQE